MNHRRNIWNEYLRERCGFRFLPWLFHCWLLPFPIKDGILFSTHLMLSSWGFPPSKNLGREEENLCIILLLLCGYNTALQVFVFKPNQTRARYWKQTILLSRFFVQILTPVHLGLCEPDCIEQLLLLLHLLALCTDLRENLLNVLSVKILHRHRIWAWTIYDIKLHGIVPLSIPSIWNVWY